MTLDLFIAGVVGGAVAIPTYHLVRHLLERNIR